MKFIRTLCNFVLFLGVLAGTSPALAESPTEASIERSIAIVRVTLEDAQGRVVERTTRAMEWGDADRFAFAEVGVVEIGVHRSSGRARVTSSYLSGQGTERRETTADLGSIVVAHHDHRGRVLVTVRAARVRVEARPVATR